MLRFRNYVLFEVCGLSLISFTRGYICQDWLELAPCIFTFAKRREFSHRRTLCGITMVEINPVAKIERRRKCEKFSIVRKSNKKIDDE